ncbi:MAG: ribulose-phosphate 3-epimerase [Verrucomicrobiota bacterium]
MVRNDSRSLIIAPSILAADRGYFFDEAKRAAESGADWLHVDIMDGHFVPNISFGVDFVPTFRKAVGGLILDVHLMIEQPDRYARSFIEAGADILTVHLEASHEVEKTITIIHDMGCKVGLAINPLTELQHALPLLHRIDLLLCMTVNPGFGGQPFIIEVLEKVRLARAYCDQHNLEVDIQVDGGVNMITAGPSVTAGANVLVAGTALFKEKDMAAAVMEMRSKATEVSSAG